MTTARPETVARASLPGPGAQLAQARTDLHLAPEDVAAKLHLATRQIEALEQDDYSSLPGPTYVRGYLKSYALLLGLSPNPILEAHTRLTAAPVSPDFRKIAPQKEITSRHHQVRFVTYLMAAIVIGLAVAWWQGHEVRPPNPLLVVRDSEPPVPSPETVPAADALNATPAMPVENLPVPAATGSAVATSKTPTPVAAATPEATPTPAAVTASPAAVPAIAALPSGPRVRLVLHADQDSWADIRDARQTRLLYDTVVAGRSVTIEAVPPVSIFLGNAAGVRLDYNGQAVDIARHKRGVVARFVLGDEAAVAAPAR